MTYHNYKMHNKNMNEEFQLVFNTSNMNKLLIMDSGEFFQGRAARKFAHNFIFKILLLTVLGYSR
jgi:hypothetical protein